MVLRGLSNVAEDSLAHDIALAHHEQAVKVFEKTGTMWENYAPFAAEPGSPAKNDFVGWSGLGPIAVLFEYVFGLRPDVPSHTLVWDVRRLERHGIEQYPFGPDGILDLECKARASATEEPIVAVTANCLVDVILRWEGGSRIIRVDIT
jgi:hypothetical protein